MKFKKASFWRLIACIFDSLILAIPSVLMWFFEEDTFYLSQGAFYAYAILMEANFQKTLGKHMMGLKVVKTNGGKPVLQIVSGGTSVNTSLQFHIAMGFCEYSHRIIFRRFMTNLQGA